MFVGENSNKNKLLLLEFPVVSVVELSPTTNENSRALAKADLSKPI